MYNSTRSSDHIDAIRPRRYYVSRLLSNRSATPSHLQVTADNKSDEGGKKEEEENEFEEFEDSEPDSEVKTSFHNSIENSAMSRRSLTLRKR